MAYFEDPITEDDLMMGRRRPRAPAAPVNPTPTNPLIRTPPYLPPTRPIAQTTPYTLPIPRQQAETDDIGMEMPSRPPGPQAPQGVPGGSFPSGPIAPMAGRGGGPTNRAQEFDMARMAALNQTPTGFKGRLLSGLRAGLGGRGFFSGVADPRGEREAEFYGKEAPQIAQRWQLEDVDRAQQQAAAQRALEEKYKNAQIGEIESQNKAREASGNLARDQFEFEKSKPTIVPPDSAVLPRGATQPTYIAPPRTREPNQMDFKNTRDQVVNEWGNARDVATSSSDNRPDSIIDTLPEEYRVILRTGKTPAGDPAGPGTAKRRLAEEAYQKARQRDIDQGTKIDEEKRDIEARRRLGQRPTGPQGPARRQNQGPPPLPITTGHGTPASEVRPVRRMNITDAQNRYKVDLSR